MMKGEMEGRQRDQNCISMKERKKEKEEGDKETKIDKQGHERINEA